MPDTKIVNDFFSKLDKLFAFSKTNLTSGRVVLLSVAALRNGGLPRAFNIFGLLVGAAGLVTVVPALSEIGGMVFGLTQIVWFAWLGIALLRPATDEAAEVVTPAFE